MKNYLFVPRIHFKKTLRDFIVSLLIGVFVVVAFVANGINLKELLLILGITLAGVASIVFIMYLLKSDGLYLINGKLYSGVKIFKKQIDVGKIVAVKKVPSAALISNGRTNLPNKHSMVFLSELNPQIAASKGNDVFFMVKKYTVCHATYDREFLDRIISLNHNIVQID